MAHQTHGGWRGSLTSCDLQFAILQTVTRIEAKVDLLHSPKSSLAAWASVLNFIRAVGSFIPWVIAGFLSAQKWLLPFWGL